MALKRAASSELVAKMRADYGVTEEAAKVAIEQVFGSLTSLVKPADAKVRITNFGTFTTKHQAERQGRNPATGAPATISAKNVTRFKATI